MADTASFAGAMKTKFIGPIRDELHAGKVLLWGSGGEGAGDHKGNPTDFQGIKASAEGIDFVGNEFRIPIKTKRNAAVGFRSENEYLPAPGASGFAYLSEPLRYAYAMFNITGQLIKASESGEGAFKQAFSSEMEDTILASKLDVNRAAYGDGSGKMTGVRTAAAAGATTIDVDSTVNFRGGEVIDFVTAAGAVVSPAHTVQTVNRTGRSITIAPGLTGALTVGTHYPVRSSSNSTIALPNNSQNKETQGLGSIVSNTGTLHGLNPTTYDFWKSYVDTTGGAIADTKIRTLKDSIGFESGVDVNGGAANFILLTTRGVRSRYSDTLVGVKRFNDSESVKLHGGFTAVMFDENPIFVDDTCPLGTMFGLSVKKLFWAQMSDWQWGNQDGDVLKWDTNRDRYVAYLYAYLNFGTTARGQHGKLTGITDDVK